MSVSYYLVGKSCRTLSLLIVLTLLPLLAACSTSPSQPATDATTPTPAALKVIKIGVDLPLSGQSASTGLPTRNGAQLAVEQINAAGDLIPGYSLQLYVLDDTVNGVHNPQQGAANAQTLISDDSVVAILGPFNSNVAKAMMPIMNQANLAMISPSVANETLTKPQYGQLATLRPSGVTTFFRLSTPDDVRAPIAADYSIDKLGFKTVYVLDDQETYGKGVAANFARRFAERLGNAAIVGRDGVPKGTTDFRTIITSVAAKQPDFIYYGGTSSNGLGLFRKQMKDTLPTTPLMGADGIVEQQFITDAGDNANGTYASLGAVNIEGTTKGKEFIAAYKARFNAEAGAYSANAYDIISIIAAAIKSSASKWRSDNPATNRETIRAAIARTKYDGVTGPTSFDPNGDTTNLNLGFYVVKDNKWQLIEQLHFSTPPTK